MSERDTDTLLKLLYDEDVEEAQRERLLADEELSSELDGYRDLRGLFREMPEEDPPEALSQKLLHAAAQEAPKSKAAAAEPAGEEGEGFLARLFGLFRPIAAHPALAAAASLLVVAGVYGTMKVTGKDEVARPEVQSAAPRGEEAAEQAPARDEPATEEEAEAAEEPAEALEEEAADGEAGGEEPGSGKTADSPAGYGAKKAKPKRPDRTRSRRRRPADTRRKNRRRGTRGRTKLDVIPKSAADEDDSAPAAGGAASGALRGGGGGAGDRGGADDKRDAPRDQAPSEKTAPPPPEPAPEAEAEEAPAPAREPAQRKKTERERSGETRARRLHKEALAAASKDQCGKVRDLAPKVRAADGTYYDRVFLEDDRIQRCLRSKR